MGKFSVMTNSSLIFGKDFCSSGFRGLPLQNLPVLE